MGRRKNLRLGFAMHELLLMAALAAVLVVAAAPKFATMQTHSKVTRALHALTLIDRAMQAYVLDHGTEPAPTKPYNPGTNPHGISWWGFCSPELTTPVAYLPVLPVMVFSDPQVYGQWSWIDRAANTLDNQPYTYIRNTNTAFIWPVGKNLVNAAHIKALLGPTYGIPQQWHDDVSNSGYVLYTSGSFNIDSAVWGGPQYYDPSNGATSLGQIFRFGAGKCVDDRYF